MKLQFEPIQPLAGSSFTLLHSTDVESVHMLWHYHPEYELVYIPDGGGRRHIGRHNARYEEGELVFIGPNLPHLSFSYGRQNPYEQIVLQLRADFMGEAFWQLPELAAVQQLFARSHQGVSFGPHTRAAVGATLREMLTQPAFPRLLSLLSVLQQLAQAPDAQSLHAGGAGLGVQGREKDRLNTIYQFVQRNFSRPIDIAELAELANLSVPAFCRYFKKMSGQTMTEFLQEYRVSQACLLLLGDASITDVSFASGFNNLSHFNKTFRKLIGQSPSEYRRQKSSELVV
ncbi:AraC family transcriptional regulator [Hymenobacter sp. BT175]|uniref:helix-turn-helix transcriptional regulator n=1 Tax=Hymenobacter translucens TaxID=2886507 RepID=UPI001D0EF3C3|nr:AraC family transcriptional regulator [Hymenobacter translucens]MCC2544904.1 AraC family transcriptional regulator [Hymenobacter translucens]